MLNVHQNVKYSRPHGHCSYLQCHSSHLLTTDLEQKNATTSLFHILFITTLFNVIICTILTVFKTKKKSEQVGEHYLLSSTIVVYHIEK